MISCKSVQYTECIGLETILCYSQHSAKANVNDDTLIEVREYINV